MFSTNQCGFNLAIDSFNVGIDIESALLNLMGNIPNIISTGEEVSGLFLFNFLLIYPRGCKAVWDD